MDVTQDVIRIVDEVLSLGGRGRSFTRASHLLGTVPEFDSMAVVALIGAIEEQFGIAVDDDEIDGQTFLTVGSLADFVAAKLGA
ncbi:MAG: phosphopantetheine-binding protein [Burkholderiaceae bacterium]|nr:phosphopantetheine-binding protein [Burkholderiaceae bacterium]